MTDALERYDYELPDHLIAQEPARPRDAARLLLLHRGQEGARHHRFHELPHLLPDRALLVVNNTKVQPVRLTARLPGGTAVEALLVEELAPGRWRAMVRKARRLKAGMRVPFAGGELPARAESRTEAGHWVLAFEAPETFHARLERHGLAPLPPYIRRAEEEGAEPARDRADYQTLHARVPGAVAAPTAGLHFTPRVRTALAQRGIGWAELTLHVGAGTFAPIQVSDPARHRMHGEWFSVPAETVQAVRAAREAGRPVVAVGTTTVRALETWVAAGGPDAYEGWSELFIRPPYTFSAVDGMITNFHLPRSTLLLLVAAFHGTERMLAAYRCAVAHGYRFYSFGDCMAILPADGFSADGGP